MPKAHWQASNEKRRQSLLAPEEIQGPWVGSFATQNGTSTAHPQFEFGRRISAHGVHTLSLQFCYYSHFLDLHCQ
jgi:hypothetical protein